MRIIRARRGRRRRGSAMEYRKEGGRGRGSHVVVELGSAGADLGIRESRKSALGEPARNH